MIPAFNNSNVLPPFLGDNPTQKAQMSPYIASISEFVRHFATSPEREAIIEGLLAYRQQLIKIGIIDGFQWLDGSFTENVEVLRKCPPNDVDIVTFAHRPTNQKDDRTWRSFINDNLNIFSSKQSKVLYRCDAYFVDLDKNAKFIVDDARYWFGLFSHQRESVLWKGMIQIPLQSDDLDASQLLTYGKKESC